MRWRKVEIAQENSEPTGTSGWWRLGAGLYSYPPYPEELFPLSEVEIAPWDEAARLVPWQRLGVAEHIPEQRGAKAP